MTPAEIKTIKFMLWEERGSAQHYLKSAESWRCGGGTIAMVPQSSRLEIAKEQLEVSERHQDRAKALESMFNEWKEMKAKLSIQNEPNNQTSIHRQPSFRPDVPQPRQLFLLPEQPDAQKQTA